MAIFACIVGPGKLAEWINLLPRTSFRSFDTTRLSFSNEIKQNNRKRRLICPIFFLFRNGFDIFRKKKT